MKYIMVMLDNWDITLVHQVWEEIRYYVGQVVIYESTELNWGLDSISFKC